MENMGDKISKTFVKHCPGTGLASVFKYRQMQEWTSKEIQSRIDEYQREQMSSATAHNLPRTHAAALFCNEAHTESQHSCESKKHDANLLSSPASSAPAEPSLSPPPVLP